MVSQSSARKKGKKKEQDDLKPAKKKVEKAKNSSKIAKKKRARRVQSNDPKVYKAWYEANKERIAARRKERYESDSDHREKIRNRNREQRERKREEVAKNPKPKVRMPRNRKPITLLIMTDGVSAPKKLFHIGTFVRMIGKSTPTIKQWERAGLLPRTPLYKRGSNKKERLFTSEMIDVVKMEILKRSGMIRISDHTFHDDIVAGWLKAGISIDESRVLGEVK